MYSLVCVYVQLYTGITISGGIVFSISGRGLSNIKWGCTSHHQLIVFCLYVFTSRSSSSSQHVYNNIGDAGYFILYSCVSINQTRTIKPALTLYISSSSAVQHHRMASFSMKQSHAAYKMFRSFANA